MPALNCTAKPKSPAVWACLGVDPLDMHRIPYQASGGNNLPCPITTTLTSSSVHHSSHQYLDMSGSPLIVFHNM